MHILGLNCYHGDSSACILRDGVLIAAAEEERFRRIKHWAGFPTESIRYCLDAAGIRLKDVETVAINQDSHANLWRKIAFTLTERPDLRLVLDRLRNKKQRASVAEELATAFSGDSFNGSVHHIEHHNAHLASAFFASPFEEAAVVSVDGFGDFASAAWAFGCGTDVSVQRRVHFPHSLGIFYEALTQYLGFPCYGDEYKVMGLAPYGQPTCMEQMRDIVVLEDDGGFRLNLEYFRHHREAVEYQWQGGAPTVGELFSPALTDLLGPRRLLGEDITGRHMDIARSTQQMFEEAFFNLLNAAHQHHHSDTLALAGGCAMNSVANGKIYRNTKFTRLYVQAAAGDAGGAVGAALAAWFQTQGRRGEHSARHSLDHAYWGPEFDSDTIREMLSIREAEIVERQCTVAHVPSQTDLTSAAAAAIANGKVVGWFQGRMEWGPRALGNRSILCDPRRSDMKEILNSKIKRRESFRPFAPSILREEVRHWFEVDDDVPFMTQVYPIREEQRARIPAVTHVDGSGRLQTVTRESNPLYHQLIGAFAHLTGIPMLLNTSFNENEPIVCRPEEALDCFLRTRMDMLVLGDWVIHRTDESPVS